TTSPNAGAKMTIANGDDSFTYYGPNTTWGSGLYTGAGESTVSAGNAQVISTNGNLHLDAGTGQNVVIGMYTASNTFINHLGGSVGIGNMTPSAKLDVTGGAVQIGTNSYEIGAVDGGLSIGNTSANYNPTTANWASGGGTTMLISGQDYSSIGFHDSGSRVDYIRAGAGVMQLGYNAGWGAATIQLPSLAGGGNRLVRAANNGDLSAISTLVGTGLGDNLGNHTATTTLDMGNQSVTNVSHVQTQGSDAYDKIRLWNSSDYSIGMRSGMSLGYLNDYAMTFTMNNDADRGWVFRDAADGTNDGAMSLTTVGDMYLKGHLLHNGNIRRTAHNNGFLEGSYNNVGGNSSYTNPIYTIGSNYNPNPTSLSNMYGIGYAHGNLWGSSGDRPTGWGQYVAADGDARIILEASGGHIWASGTVRANGGYKVDGLTVIDDGGGWHRSYGNTGWYNGTHGGGWYMTDNTWIRSYNNKAVYTGSGEIRSDNSMRAPIFIDQNDGNYWLDPNAGLSLNAKGDLRIGQGSTTDDDWIYFDQNNSQWFGWQNSWGDFRISEDLNMGDRSLWDVNNLQVNTIYDNEDTRVEITDDLRIDYAGSSTDVYFDGHNGHPAIRPGYAGWGYLGKFNNWWLEQWAWREYRNGEYYFSDRRVKQNIRSLDSKTSLEKVMALNGKIYDFNPETHPFVTEDARDYEITNNLGFIAQELKEVIPEMVVLDENTGLYQVMNSEQLFPVMIEAMKEQQKQIEALKGGGSNEEVESLRNEVQELRGLINKLMEAN
ncbi:tail fiber domain-containing protein, partial [Flavobacteriales bacterium]|nr:tail fiber domain-containing protein [Flavobacteriales bacterium]